MSEAAKKYSQPINSRELAVFCQQLSVVITSDITIMEGMLMLAQQADDRRLRVALTTVYSDMNHGMVFSEAMGRHRGLFPAYMLNMIAIGEQSGSLDSVLARLATYYEKESIIKRKVKNAATYPVILTILMLGVILLLILRILPSFSDILTSVGGEIPTLTKAVLDIGAFFGKNGAVVLLVIAAAALILVIMARTRAGRYAWNAFTIKIPVVHTVITRIVTARFARGLSIQLHAGIPLSTALALVDSLVDNSYIVRKLERARRDIQDGKDLYEALDSARIFPPLFMRMALIGQKTGNIDVMLDKAANLFEDEVDSALERVVTAVEPTLIIILSIIVGIILLSVMLPMISIISSIG